jgi:hypothetical protein
MDGLNNRIDGEVTVRIDSLSQKVDSVHNGLTQKIESIDNNLSTRIDGLESDLRDIRGELSGIRSDMNSQLRWIIGLFAAQFVTLATMIFG